MLEPMIIIWGLLMLVGFAGSALFSGMETGCYRINRVRLYVRASQGNRQARLLDKLINKPAALLGTLLIGNNLMNYLGTAGLGVILAAAELPVWEAVLINTVLVTAVLFVFGETLPKDLFAAHADRLMYPFARALSALRWVFTLTLALPVVVALSGLAVRLFGGGEGPLTPRKRVAEMVNWGAGLGLLSDEQTEIARRAMAMSARTIGGEATPWNQVLTVRENATPQELQALARRTARSSFPVLDAKGQPVGVLDLLDALLLPEATAQPARAAQKNAVLLDAKTPIRQALARLQREHLGMAIVTGNTSRPIGIITVKDLVEPLTGEITQW
ncbi:MAG: CNNM domain-containing protein [Planctomycetota bacterium]